ncbi:hypothetical protein Tco_0610018 [Tanacetum coccineum]
MRCLALANLALAQLMPLSVWKKISLPELTPTRMTLELANRSVAYPVGVAEDVFVKVGKYDDESVNRIDVIDVTCEEYAQEGSDLFWKSIEACLTSDSIPSGIDDAEFDSGGETFFLLVKFLKMMILLSLPLKDLIVRNFQ